MRFVLDTNVLVSALLKPASVPARALSRIWSTGAVVLYDARLIEEYREVLFRPKFKGIDAESRNTLLARLQSSGTDVGAAVARWGGLMTDDDDRAFVEVALAGRADAIITGNIRDFPNHVGFRVDPPATLLALLEG
jgi:putative PIN family toxin of toxin-antitoxin system